MDIKPIKTAKDYRAALRKIEGLMQAKANTPEGDRLDVLVTLVEAYERQHFPMDLPDAFTRKPSIKPVRSTPFSEFIRNASSAEKKKVYKQVLERATEQQNRVLNRSTATK